MRNAKALAYGLLVSGLTYTGIASFLLLVGVRPLSASLVYSAQLMLIPGIIAFARIVVSRNREAMKPRAAVGIDGSWDHRRNGSAHVISMMDIKSGRVVDYEVVRRAVGRRPGNYVGSSNGMEVEAMRRMIGRWEGDQKVETVITDQDSKLAKVIRESRWDVRHDVDSNHAKKSLARYVERLAPELRRHLFGLGKRLSDWFNHVIHQRISREEKVEQWENAFQHYRGDHGKCPDPEHTGYLWRNRDDPEAQETLRGYLAAGSDIIRKVDPLTGSTQLNESFHNVKAKFADKRLDLKGSTEARFALSVISHSGGPRWEEELRQHLDVPALPGDCRERLRREEQQRQRRGEARREEPARRRRNDARNKYRGGTARNRRGQDDYGPGGAE